MAKLYFSRWPVKQDQLYFWLVDCYYICIYLWQDNKIQNELSCKKKLLMKICFMNVHEKT